MKTLEDDMKCVLSTAGIKDRSLWRGRIHGVKWPTWVNMDI
jgi:hypothetical protein